MNITKRCGSEVKALLIQHFGDPRSEVCIAFELNFEKFVMARICIFAKNQSVRSNLFSNVNLNEDGNMKQSKMIIYNNMVLNVFFV